MELHLRFLVARLLTAACPLMSLLSLLCSHLIYRAVVSFVRCHLSFNKSSALPVYLRLSERSFLCRTVGDTSRHTSLVFTSCLNIIA